MKRDALATVSVVLINLLSARGGAEPTPTATAQPTDPVTAEPRPTATADEGAFPHDLAAQLDAFLQSQVYTEGGDPGGAAPGMVLLVDTPEGRSSRQPGSPAWRMAPRYRSTIAWRSGALPWLRGGTSCTSARFGRNNGESRPEA